MGQVKKLLIIIGKPVYWLILLSIFLFKQLFSAFLAIGRLSQKILIKISNLFITSLQIIRQKKFILFLPVIGVIIGLGLLGLNLFHDLPSPNHLITRPSPLTTKIYDRNGELLYKIYRNENRTLVPLNELPQHLIEATLAIEDKEFYQHKGLSIKGIIRAIEHNLSNPKQTKIGGSTITQQLVKNALLTPKKTWRRKIREALLAILVETRFSKNEILQMYFNEVPYGGTAYGIEEAAQKYFQKSATGLTLPESALLAGLTRAPTKYSPFGAYPEKAKQRQKQVIQEMLKAGYLSPQQAEQAINQKLRFAHQGNGIKAPHFVFYVKNLLAEKYGQAVVEQGGLEVTTSLDWQLQQKAKQTVDQELNKLQRLRVGNGAVLIINPQNGEILAMVGSKDYWNFANDGNVNVTLRPRQPGSAIKPINYAVALQMGYTPATILSDTPITYRLPGRKPYSPKNYDNQFHGRLPLRTALASSLNVPAVKVLSSYGVNKMANMGQELGITTWDDPSRFGLSLTLGAVEVKMIDLAQAYATFANYGKKVDINPILKIKDQKGGVLYTNPCLKNGTCPHEEVLGSGIAFLINDILADNQARSLAFGRNSLLKIPNHQVAVKTGTSNNIRDNWCYGYTENILVGAWVGNNDNSPMSQVASGVTGATPIWHNLITDFLKDKPKHTWTKPDDIIEEKICRTTGTLPCKNCPYVDKEYFLTGSQPDKHCYFQTANKDPSSLLPANKSP
jgi:1A family penicillin-binding protein